MTTKHAPSYLREDFQEWLDSFEPDGLQKMSINPVAELLEALEDCGDILPADYCDQLEIPKGSTYADAVVDLRKGSERREAAKANPDSRIENHKIEDHKGPATIPKKEAETVDYRPFPEALATMYKLIDQIEGKSHQDARNELVAFFDRSDHHPDTLYQVLCAYKEHCGKRVNLVEIAEELNVDWSGVGAAVEELNSNCELEDALDCIDEWPKPSWPVYRKYVGKVGEETCDEVILGYFDRHHVVDILLDHIDADALEEFLQDNL